MPLIIPDELVFRVEKMSTSLPYKFFSITFVLLDSLKIEFPPKYKPLVAKISTKFSLNTVNLPTVNYKIYIDVDFT